MTPIEGLLGRLINYYRKEDSTHSYLCHDVGVQG